jgi:S1-C subfamily serine protease
MRERLRVLVCLVTAVIVLASCSFPDLFSEGQSQPTQAPLPVQVITAVVTLTPAQAAAEEPPLNAPAAQSEEARRVAVYEQVAPAVVNITTQVLRTDFFWGSIPEEGSGSGFLWDDQGHVVTNYHVIEGAREISVAFGDDVNLAATVVGADPQNDLAVLRVEGAPTGVRPIPLGSSAELKVGQTAIAIGNPFGQFERTMTDGIVSALNRTIETDDTVLRGIIQTDAAINRGNSGGPLLNLQGQLIGVNTAIFSPTGTSAGVGLAIPVDKVQRVVPELIATGRYPHPWLGIEELGYEITPALAQALGLPVEQGLLIARIYQGSPADEAGVRGARQEVILRNRRYLVGGDILVAIDGRPLTEWDQLNAYLDEEARVGQTVILDLIRDGQPLQLQATLSDTPR